MTIHSSHPFLEPESERDPVRRLRGRLGGTVTLWTTGSGPSRAGLTVSSLMVANGELAHALALIDPDSDFAVASESTGTAVVQRSRVAAPGPSRRLRRDRTRSRRGLQAGWTWTDTKWGPVLEGASAWAGVRLAEELRHVGWSSLVDTVVEHVEIAEEAQPLVHRWGRYQPLR